MFIQDDQRIQEALARLISQYQGSEKLKSMISAFIQPLQDLEGVLTQMNTLRYLPDAAGAQLDIIGAIVGIPRPPGASDAVYRNDIYGQIKINTSEGQPEQIIQTFQLFTGTSPVLLFEEFPAEIIINSPYLPPDQANVELLLNILLQALPAGVRPVQIVAYDPGSSFAYDGSLSGQGYGSISDPTQGGKYPQVFQTRPPFAYAGNDPAASGYGTILDPLVGGVYVS